MVKRNRTSSEPFQSVETLEDLLSMPTTPVVTALAKLKGDFVVLGVSDPAGSSLAQLLKRAFVSAKIKHHVIGVASVAEAGSEATLQSAGIETVNCDLLDDDLVRKLPEAPNVICMPGTGADAAEDEASRWAANTLLPAVVCKRYRQSRVVAFSTGNIYEPTLVSQGGSVESDPVAPVGERAMSCLGRERIFEYFSQKNGTPVALVRLSHVCELRYGILAELAKQVWEGEVIDLAGGYFNAIWQSDAHTAVIQALAHAASPALIINVTGPEILSVHKVCEDFGRWMNRQPKFTGAESPTALLSNARQAGRLFGPPHVKADQMMRWVAEWVMRGERN